MVQCGHMRTYQRIDRRIELSSSEQLFARPLVLEQGSAGFILAGLRRSMPIDVFDVSALHSFCPSPAWSLISFCVDRASANFNALGQMWVSFQSPDAPAHLLPHIEPCFPHGIALTKNKPKSTSLRLLTDSHSFACWMRGWKNVQSLRSAIISLVEAHLQVIVAPRPPGVAAQSKRLVELLYGDLSARWLFVSAGPNKGQPTSFHQDLLCIIDNIALGSGDLSTLVHYCHTGERNGRPVKCCRTRDESVEKISVALVNLICGRAWDKSAISRWTYMSTTFRRLALASCAHGILAKALADVQVFFEVDASLEARLAKLVAADSNDFSSKNKLRLLKIATRVNDPSFTWQLAVLITTTSCLDQLLTKTLGDGTAGSRMTLRDIVDPRRSPVCECSKQFWFLLADWSADSASWELFRMLGGSADNKEAKLFARRHLLQLAAALVQYFEARLSKPPYTLLHLLSNELGREEQLAICQVVVDEPNHCLPLFCRRLRAAFPSAVAILAGAMPMVEALGGCNLSVDRCERGHAQMRLYLLSTPRDLYFRTMNFERYSKMFLINA